MDLPVPQPVKCQLITTSNSSSPIFPPPVPSIWEFPRKVASNYRNAPEMQALGAPARAGGVQSFTTLWFEKDAPSESHIAQTARPWEKSTQTSMDIIIDGSRNM